jgi:hypothetical protein
MVKRGWSPPENLVPKIKRFKLEQEGKKLKITAYWSEWSLPILLVSLFLGCQLLPYGFLYLLDEGGSSYLLFLIAFIGLGLITSYSVLVSWFNKTIINISPEEVEVTAGPLPWPSIQRRQLDVRAIHQLRVVKESLGHDLQAIYGQRRQAVVLLRMLGRAAALYLEEEISDYLSLPLPAEPVPLPQQYKKEDWAKVYQFAEAHQLHTRISKFSVAPVLSGLYQGCQLKISFFKWTYTAPLPLTRLLLSVVQREVLPLPVLDQGHSSLQVAQHLEALLSKTFTLDLSGTLEITPDGQHLFYEEANLRTDPASLEALCETMLELLRIYPRLAYLSGQAVSLLQPLAAQKHPFQPVAIQLLRDIAKETQNRLAEQANTLICPSCLRHCAAHEIKLSLTDRLTYYGCRACGQSLEFLPARKAVIAILDTQMTQNYISRDDVLYGNWLLHRQGFDFDEVYIRQASDEDVERFAVQVGNDTDPLQQPRYAAMRCLIWPAAGLSENSLKILQHTFGRMEIKAQASQKLQETEKISGARLSRLNLETQEKGAEDAQER